MDRKIAGHSYVEVTCPYMLCYPRGSQHRKGDQRPQKLSRPRGSEMLPKTYLICIF